MIYLVFTMSPNHEAVWSIFKNYHFEFSKILLIIFEIVLKWYICWAGGLSLVQHHCNRSIGPALHTKLSIKLLVPSRNSRYSLANKPYSRAFIDPRCTKLTIRQIAEKDPFFQASKSSLTPLQIAGQSSLPCRS